MRLLPGPRPVDELLGLVGLSDERRSGSLANAEQERAIAAKAERRRVREGNPHIEEASTPRKSQRDQSNRRRGRDVPPIATPLFRGPSAPEFWSRVDSIEGSDWRPPAPDGDTDSANTMYLSGDEMLPMSRDLRWRLK